MVLKCKCGGSIIAGDGESICSMCGRVYDFMVEEAVSLQPAESVRRTPQVHNWRLARLNSMVQGGRDRADTTIEDICRKCGVPDLVYRRACALHAMMIAHDIHRGWNITVRAAAMVYLACRLEAVPRTSAVVCEAADVKSNQMHRIYAHLVTRLNIAVPPPDPVAYVAYVAGPLGIPESTRRSAVKLLKECRKIESGKDPTTMAAAALFIAASKTSEPISQTALSKASGVSTVSIRLRRRDIAAHVRHQGEPGLTMDARNRTVPA